MDQKVEGEREGPVKSRRFQVEPLSKVLRVMDQDYFCPAHVSTEFPGKSLLIMTLDGGFRTFYTSGIWFWASRRLGREQSRGLLASRSKFK